MIHVDRPAEAPNGSEKREPWLRYQAEIQECLNNPHTWGEKLPKERLPRDRIPGLWVELCKIFHNKCAYCETNLDKDGQLTWYRPRRDVQQVNQDGSIVTAKDHYFWLSWTWSNMYPACRECVIKKRFWFPIAGERAARGVYGLKLLDEQPLLLDPCVDEPLQFLEFYENGEVGAKADIENKSKKRAEITIKTLDLNRKTLIEKRQEHIRQLRVELDKGFDATIANNGEIDNDIRSCIDNLRKQCEISEFAGMKRQLLYRWMQAASQSSDLSVAINSLRKLV